MKSYRAAFLMLVFLVWAAPAALAVGEGITVFESSGEGGLWDHGGAFYLRFSMKNHRDVWAGLEKASDGAFAGEVVFDQFTAQERRAAARATLLVDGPKRKVIELFFTPPGESDSIRLLLDRVPRP